MNRLIIGICSVLILSSSGWPGPMPDPAKSALQGCSDVSKIDFRNSTIPLQDGGSFTLVDGKGCASDGLPGKCDWEQTLELDRVLNPEPGTILRLIVVNSNHKTGSGAWDYVLVFACRAGQLQKVLHNRYLYGAALDPIGDKTLKIKSGHWLETDPMCCPSVEKFESFEWDKAAETFKLSGIEYVPQHDAGR